MKRWEVHYDKIVKVIRSCKTNDHIKCCYRMIQTYEKIFLKGSGYSNLRSVLSCQKDRIENDKVKEMYHV